MPNVPKGNGALGPRARVLAINMPPPKLKKKKKKTAIRSKPKRRKRAKNPHDPRCRSTAYISPVMHIKIAPDRLANLTQHIFTTAESYEVIYLDGDK